MSNFETSPDPEAALSEMAGRAQRYETPCANGTLVWRVWGMGRPVVLLHGAHGFWAHWIRNIDALAAQHSVWVPDLPGMGDSELADGGDHRAITAPIATGIRQLLGSQCPVDVVGFSFGGVISAHLAALYPEIVRRLIVVDAGGLHTPLGEMTLKSTRGLDPVARAAASHANLLAIMLHNPASADALALWIQSSGIARARFNPASLIMPDHLIRVLPNVLVPFDAIWGEYDRPHPVREQEQALRRFRPDMQFRVIPQAGHWCMYENSEAFNRILIEMLETH
jgi:pimeloyl-ACP methyl ester carboxylesterase